MVASVLSGILAPSWLSFWEWIEFGSIIVIAAGCWGEGWTEHHRFSDDPKSLMPVEYLKQRYRVFFWKMVVMGLGVELIAFCFSFIASNREIEGLKEANIELAARLNPRAITADQRENFLRIVKDWPKGPVRVYVASSDPEPVAYAIQIRHLLDEAHYNQDGERVIRRDDLLPQFDLPYPPGHVNFKATPVFIVLFTPDPLSLSLPGTPPGTIRTNFFPGMMIVSERTDRGTVLQRGRYDPSDIRALPGLIYQGLSDVGIHTMFLGVANGFTNGEWAVLVAPMSSR
ncbi:MAG TPA: hypothetical protein VMV72_04505 [Verrucomicrobiae bacterium]|nr:hypothetical protein [Verrucomicrobiae bacterium]